MIGCSRPNWRSRPTAARQSSCLRVTYSSRATTSPTKRDNGLTCNTGTDSNSPSAVPLPSPGTSQPTEKATASVEPFVSRRTGYRQLTYRKPNPALAAKQSPRCAMLAELEAEDVGDAFAPLIDGYLEWLQGQMKMAAQLPDHLQGPGGEAIAEAELAASRLREGLEYLSSNPQAVQAFRFMNRAMREQRIHSQVAIRRAADDSECINDALSAIEAKGDDAASWRPFQLAFILLQLPALTDPAHAIPQRRRGQRRAAVLPDRRRQDRGVPRPGGVHVRDPPTPRQVVDTDDGALDGGDGVAVLMRYTLRLLTSQQFQRAAALVCAAELHPARRPGDVGDEPFRIGLWVGDSVSPEVLRRTRRRRSKRRERTTRQAYRLDGPAAAACPWCGTKIDPQRDLRSRSRPTERIEVYCGDRKGDARSAGGRRRARACRSSPSTRRSTGCRRPSCSPPSTSSPGSRAKGEAASLFGYVSRALSAPRIPAPRHARTACKGSRTTPTKAVGQDYPRSRSSPSTGCGRRT